MGTYGETVHRDEIEGYRLLIERDRYGAYMIDLEPTSVPTDDDDDGVHAYLTDANLISLGASIQAEIERRRLS